jgi:peptide/nickel transport system substrate-binding protein
MKGIRLLLAGLILALMLAACGATPEPKIVEKEVTKVVPEKVVETVIVAGTPEIVEKIVTATPEPETGPVPGGTLVYSLQNEPDTLDAHKSGILFIPCQFFGASLIARDPETGEFVPYLAESWTQAADGLSYEFKLRQDVKFHDGTPLTAQDYAFTFNRAIAPETKSPTAGQTLLGLVSAEAVDDYTLRLNMQMPNAVLLDSLSNTCYLQPMPQAAVEKMGDDFGRSPIGAGPFKFKEWVTGEKIVLERNPDFNWGPAFTHGGAPYIETLEFRIIPEYATSIAALEAGDVDFALVEPKDVERIKGLAAHNMLEVGIGGSGLRLEMDSTRWPFDDVLVRQAFNYAIARDAIVQVVQSGLAVPNSGPITPASYGYWPGVEYVGYAYDLEKAKALMAEAGYTLNTDGVLEKDGKPLTLRLFFSGQSKLAEVLQQQFKELGVALDLQQLDYAVLTQTLSGNDWDLAIDQLGWPNAGVLYVMFSSATIGGWNRSHTTALDPIIFGMVLATSEEAFMKGSADIQKAVIEGAYGVPLYGTIDHYALSNKVQGPVYSPASRWLYLWDAYIETGPVE